MPDALAGIHHITGICGPAQRNLDFYSGVLGLRFVKKTVNFDDPGTYHLYYGDDIGRPGTILTFFPWENAMTGRAGAGMSEATAFAVPEDNISFWKNRLSEAAVKIDGPFERFGSSVLRCYDPDGLPLELVGHDNAHDWPERSESPLPVEEAIRGFFGITLFVQDARPTATLLTETFGYAVEAEEGRRTRLAAPGQEPGRHVDLLEIDDRGRPGRGTIHHVAFRAADGDEQLAWREKLIDLGFDVTDVRDRQYFRSIYFREPNGILFEIATDGPGFTADEEASALGTELRLPPWLEARRSAIEERLPALQEPSRGASAWVAGQRRQRL